MVESRDVIDADCANPTRVDGVQLVCLGRIREVREEVRSTAAVETFKTAIELSQKRCCRVQTVLLGPAAEISLPRLARCHPVLTLVVQEVFGLFRAKLLKAPPCCRFVEALPVPLHHDHQAARGQAVRDLVEHDGRLSDVMQRRACHDGVNPNGKVARLEPGPNVTGALRGERIDPESPIAIVLQCWDEAAKPSAAEFHDRRWWWRQSAPNLWPQRRQPSLVGGHTPILAARAVHSLATVTDISKAALERAGAELGAEANKVKWIEADVRHHNFGRTFDLWHDRAVFHFMVRPIAIDTSPCCGELCVQAGT